MQIEIIALNILHLIGYLYFFPFHKNIFMQHFSRAVEVIVIGQWLASNKKNWLCSDRE